MYGVGGLARAGKERSVPARMVFEIRDFIQVPFFRIAGAFGWLTAESRTSPRDPPEGVGGQLVPSASWAPPRPGGASSSSGGGSRGIDPGHSIEGWPLRGWRVEALLEGSERHDSSLCRTRASRESSGLRPLPLSADIWEISGVQLLDRWCPGSGRCRLRSGHWVGCRAVEPSVSLPVLLDDQLDGLEAPTGLLVIAVSDTHQTIPMSFLELPGA